MQCSPFLWNSYPLGVAEGLLMWSVALLQCHISCTAVLSNQPTLYMQCTEHVSRALEGLMVPFLSGTGPDGYSLMEGAYGTARMWMQPCAIK